MKDVESYVNATGEEYEQENLKFNNNRVLITL